MMADVKIISTKDYEKMKMYASVEIRRGFHDSPFGRCLVGVLEDRICHISFVNGEESANLKVLRAQWPGARLIADEEVTGKVARGVFTEGVEWKALLKGTPFEASVWKALMKIPRGTTVSYEEVARICGRSGAVRAVANAVAKNSVSYLVPCHRVVRKNGSLHKYRWGSHIKRKIVHFERST